MSKTITPLLTRTLQDISTPSKNSSTIVVFDSDISCAILIASSSFLALSIFWTPRCP